MKISISPFITYLLVPSFIAAWWYLAFTSQSTIPETPLSPEKVQQSLNSDLCLSTLNRETLQQALAGDTSLMVKLLSEWDVDAQLMQQQGVHQAQRLTRTDYLRAQLICRQLKGAASKRTASCRFLPQTYVSASFLLALAPIEEIAALPKRLREQEQLYPRSLTGRVPLDCDRYHSEKLFLAAPQVAFIAHYSHPATVQALKNQGVQLYRMRNLGTVSDICEELLSIGNVIHRPLEAELLKIFMEAAMLAIDNRMASLHLSIACQEKPRVLFLNYHQTYSIPTRRTLTGQLLHRLGIFEMQDDSSAWSIPIDKESIRNLDPDCLIIATENANALKREIQNDPTLGQLSAVRSHHLFFVDEAVQGSSSQYIVLAYHDLFQALASLP